MAPPVRKPHGNGSEVKRWDPVGEIARLSDHLANYLDSWHQLPDERREGFTPLADLEETPDAYVVEIELPGVKADDIDVEVAGRRVTVRGERREKARVGTLRKQERTVGRFAYEITLPGDFDEDSVEAHLEEGVLSVRLAKPDAERPRHIPVR